MNEYLTSLRTSSSAFHALAEVARILAGALADGKEFEAKIDAGAGADQQPDGSYDIRIWVKPPALRG